MTILQALCLKHTDPLRGDRELSSAQLLHSPLTWSSPSKGPVFHSSTRPEFSDLSTLTAALEKLCFYVLKTRVDERLKAGEKDLLSYTNQLILHWSSFGVTEVFTQNMKNIFRGRAIASVVNGSSRNIYPRQRELIQRLKNVEGKYCVLFPYLKNRTHIHTPFFKLCWLELELAECPKWPVGSK